MLSAFFDRITELSLRFRWITIALTLIALAAGVYALTGLNLELLPRIEFPQTVVVVQWNEAGDNSGPQSAEDFLQQVTIPLEERIAVIDGIVNVESTTNQSFAFIIVRNDFGLNQEAVVEAIQTAVADASLPAGAETQVLNFSLSDLPVVVASISSADLSLPELKELVQTELQPRLQAVDQVSEVSISGGQELPTEEVVVEVEPTPQPTPEPGRLPLVVIQGARSLGLNIEYAQEVTPDVLAAIEGTDEQVLTVLGLIPPDTLRYAPPETLALLPQEFMETLDPALQAELDELAADYGGINQYTIAEARAVLSGEPLETATPEPPPTPEATAVAVEPVNEAPAVEPVPLPEAWVAGAAALGQTITTTADVTPDLMQAVVGFAPEQLALLTPPMWRALDPAVAAIALPVAAADLEPILVVQLQAIQLAAAGEEPEPVPLPTAWVTAASGAGLTITTTADITPDAVSLVADSAPELLDTLTPEVILAFPPPVLAALPANTITGLDEGMQQTIRNILIMDAQQAASADTAPEPETSSAGDRLPDTLIQGARAAGVELEFAQDITPDFMRTLASFGPQGLQALRLLTPDNLRHLQPEVIALLPADFLDTLDADLRAELDALAAEYGGAGQLAVSEAEEAATESAAPPDTSSPDASPPGDSPALTGAWTEPGPNGEPSLFTTAADILNNRFVPGAATFLNFLPGSPTVQDPAALIGSLTPDVVQYLAENEEGFVTTLSPSVLELMSPETLAFLLSTYPDAFDADLTQRLQGIATGEIDVFVPEASITRTDGNPSVIVNLFKAGDANTVEVAHGVFAVLEAFETDYPGVETNLVFEQATFIEESIAGVSREGALGGVFAIIVILLFLSGQAGGRYKLSWRATLVTAVSIPLSIFTAFLLMRLIPPTLGTWLNDAAEASSNGLWASSLTFIARLFPRNVTLNIMTLSGLTVAIGRVVDDSIVVLENSYRYIQQGDDPKHAILAGTKEVAIAIFSATVTTMAVFLPLGLIGGLIGSFFLPFGLTVTYALAASFIVSITVVPALTYLLIRREHIPEERETTMQRWYTPALVWALNHRFYTLLIAAVIFAASLFLLGQLPQSFIPAIGEPTINISVTLPPGTPMVETNEQVAALESAVQGLDGIRTVQTEVGSGGGIAALFGGGGVSQNVANVTIAVDDQDRLTELTGQVRQAAIATVGEENVRVSAESQTGFGGFSLVLTGDSLAALQAVVPDVKAALGAVDVDGNGVPDIANVSSNVDNTTVGEEDSVIIRIDGRPAVSFSGELETQNTLGVTAEAKAAVAALDSLPPGAQVTEGFESEQQVEGFRSMVVAILYSIVIVYVIMALTFRSLIHPFTILFSLPFALVGAAIALYITDSVLGISAMIGFMMLVGIVVTNGIVLMELVQQLRARGRNAFEALVEGGRTRLRPIWMTALTAILALIPLAVSSEAGAIIASELARVVMGGLLVSTALTLLVVPVVYSLFDELAHRLRRT